MNRLPNLPQDWVEEVHRFWFEALQPEAWFRADPATDSTIRERFSGLHRALMAHVPAPTRAEAALATVIVLDQFSRNMFRGSEAACAADPVALGIAQSAIAAGFDRQLNALERQFLYMPFQHSEDPAMQRRSVALFADLGLPEPLAFAEQHKLIIDRFGRFPQRNAALGRVSTPEEVEFLKIAPQF